MYGSFFGWYFKCQSDTQTFAVIPAVHQTGQKSACSIQIITENKACILEFPGKAFQQIGKNIVIEKNCFGPKGIHLSICKPDLILKGHLNFGPLTPLKYDIMGPFALVPFMECRHSVWSMRHSVQGKIRLNEEICTFQNAVGYWEGDLGRSFPKNYIWTQCCFPEGSLMLSVADIPMLGSHFTGIIGVILWRGKIYRLATYLGAKAVWIRPKALRIVQGNLSFEAHLLEESGHPLRAPSMGSMVRTIHESAACRAFYHFKKNDHSLFAFKTNRASFEYEYPSKG